MYFILSLPIYINTSLGINYNVKNDIDIVFYCFKWHFGSIVQLER